MKKLGSELKEFLQCKVYVLILSLVAACSYGFTMVHPSIGMDDTAIPLYFKEGLAPYVGRWTLYIINKFFRIDDFAPWMVELVSILLFMLSVTLWCILFRRICQWKVTIPTGSYVFVAAIFLSSPIISEIYVFYLHNGICIGYGMTALAVLSQLNCLSEGCSRKRQIGNLLSAAAFLTLALGCYESFVVVYACGVIMSFFLIRVLYGKKETGAPYRSKAFSWIVTCAVTGGLSLAFRGIVLAIVKAVFGLDKFAVMNVAYRSLFSGLFQDSSEMIMELKRFFMKFYVNAFVYIPIAVLVVSFVGIGFYSLYKGIRQKDIFLPLCSGAMVILPVIMCMIEGIATRYRTGQYIPLVGAFAVMLLLIELHGNKLPKVLPVICYGALGILLYNQCQDMNRWFYLDYLKYEDAKAVMKQVAYDLEKDYDTTKPIVFRGAYRVPYEITQDAYCSFSSKQYQWICRVSDLIDPHLKEKYFAENGRGYIFAETPIVSTLQWGVTAFDGTAGQLEKFWSMHGHSFVCERDLDKIEEAEEIRNEVQMPGYPMEGYILECEEYIIVNLESAQ